MTESSQIDLSNIASPPNYKITGYLGNGAMGCVYKAYHLNLEKEVALKTCSLNDNDPMQNSDRLLQEARTVARLDHPYIVRVTDCFIWNEQIYIAMEYLKGETLGDLLVKKVDDLPENSIFREWMPSDGKLTPRHAVMVIDKLAQALDFAHSKSIYHRDLKPTNIFVLDDGSIKLIDFSIASDQKKSMTRSGVVVGSPPYMSPEQIRGEKVDGRCDIYSLGCVLFHCITGTTPFQDTSEIMICIKHLNVSPPDPKELEENCPTQLRNIILKCLEKNREKRYANMQELRKDIASLGFAMAESARETASTVTPLPLIEDSISTEMIPIPKASTHHQAIKKLMVLLMVTTVIALMAIGYFLVIAPPPAEPKQNQNEVVVPTKKQPETIKQESDTVQTSVPKNETTAPVAEPIDKVVPKPDPLDQTVATDQDNPSQSPIMIPKPALIQVDPAWRKLMERQQQAVDTGLIAEGITVDSIKLTIDPAWGLEVSVQNTQPVPVEIFGMIKEGDCVIDTLSAGKGWSIRELHTPLDNTTFGHIDSGDESIILPPESTTICSINIPQLEPDKTNLPLFASITITDLRLFAEKTPSMDEVAPPPGDEDFHTTETLTTTPPALEQNRALPPILSSIDLLDNEEIISKAGRYLAGVRKIDKSHPDLKASTPKQATNDFIKFLKAARKAQDTGMFIPLNQYGCKNLKVKTDRPNIGSILIDDFTVYINGAWVDVTGFIIDGYQTMDIKTGATVVEATRSLQGQMIKESLPYTKKEETINLMVGGEPIIATGTRFLEQKDFKITQMLIFLEYTPNKRLPRNVSLEKRPEISFKCLNTD